MVSAYFIFGISLYAGSFVWFTFRLKKKSETHLSTLQRQQFEKMVETQDFAELGRNLTGLIHDLTSPLTAAQLSAEALLRESLGSGEKDLVPLTRTTLQSIEQTGRLLTALRKRIAKQEFETTFSVREEISQAILTLSYQARFHQVKVETRVEPLLLQGNAISFYKIVQNLVSNAIDAYEGVKRRENRLVRVVCQITPTGVLLEVQDFAVGIPKTCLPRIYEPFYTTKAPAKGTGIGLTIVKALITQEFQGSVYIASKLGKGTLVRVGIPVTRLRPH